MKNESYTEQHIVLLTTVSSEIEYLQVANVLDEHSIPFYKGGGSSIYQGANHTNEIIDFVYHVFNGFYGGIA